MLAVTAYPIGYAVWLSLQRYDLRFPAARQFVGLAMIMRWALVGRGVVRTAILIPYGIVTVVAAYSWQYAWTPGTGYLANLLHSGSAPLTEQWPATRCWPGSTRPAGPT
jgi:multiple sugar transport system permease protein